MKGRHFRCPEQALPNPLAHNSFQLATASPETCRLHLTVALTTSLRNAAPEKIYSGLKIGHTEDDVRFFWWYWGSEDELIKLENQSRSSNIIYWGGA